MKKGRHEEIQKNVKVKEGKSHRKLIRRLVTAAIILGLICISGVIGVIKARNEEPIMLDNIQKEQDLLAVDGQITTLGDSYKLTIQYNYRPVSYTHPDVYKRQVPRSIRSMRLRPAPPKCSLWSTYEICAPSAFIISTPPSLVALPPRPNRMR